MRAFRRGRGVAGKDDDEGREGPLSRRRTPPAASLAGGTSIESRRGALMSRPMAVDLSLLGTPSEPFDFDVEAERAKAYAAATNDPNPKYASGELAPPVFAVVPVFAALA